MYNKNIDLTKWGRRINIILDVDIGGKSEKIILKKDTIMIPIPTATVPSSTAPKLEPKTKGGDTTTSATTTNVMSSDDYPIIPQPGVRLPVSKLQQMTYADVVNFFFDETSFIGIMERYGNDEENKSIWSFIQQTSNFILNGDGKSLAEKDGKSLAEKGGKPLAEKDGKSLAEKDGKSLAEKGGKSLAEKGGKSLAEKGGKPLAEEIEKQNIYIEKKNMYIMMRLLFPTQWCFNDHKKTSMQHWLSESTDYYVNASSSKFSYLKHGGSVYTITNAVWLNDIFNVPFYRTLLKSFKYYTQWKTNIISILTHQLNKLSAVTEPVSSPSIQSINTSTEITRESLDAYIKILKQPILSQSEYNNYLKKKDKNKIFEKYIHPTLSATGSNPSPLTIYKIIFADDSTKKKSASNGYINDVVYFTDFNTISETKPSDKLVDKTADKTVNYQKLFEQLMKSMVAFTGYSNGDTSVLTSNGNITDISTIYYAGLMLNNKKQGIQPMYDVYVQIDVIKGVVDETNISTVKCQYENHSIGKKIETMFKFFGSLDKKQALTWDMSVGRIYMSLDSKNEPVVTTTSLPDDSNDFKEGEFTLDNKYREAIYAKILNSEKNKTNLSAIFNKLSEQHDNVKNKTEYPLPDFISNNPNDNVERLSKWIYEKKFPITTDSELKKLENIFTNNIENYYKTLMDKLATAYYKEDSAYFEKNFSDELMRFKTAVNDFTTKTSIVSSVYSDLINYFEAIGNLYGLLIDIFVQIVSDKFKNTKGGARKTRKLRSIRR